MALTVDRKKDNFYRQPLKKLLLAVKRFQGLSDCWPSKNRFN